LYWIELPNKGMEMDFEKLALFKTTHARRYAYSGSKQCLP